MSSLLSLELSLDHTLELSLDHTLELSLSLELFLKLWSLDVTSEMKLQGHKALCKREITQMDITSHCLLSSSQEPSK